MNGYRGEEISAAEWSVAEDELRERQSERTIIDITPREQAAQEALVVVGRADALVITDKPSYENAREFLLTIKDRQKKLDETFDPIIKKAHQTHSEAVAQKRRFSDPLKLAETALKNRISAFLISEETKRKAEENRLRLIAEKEAEERRLADALAAEAEGDLEEAEAILDEVPAFVPPPIVSRTVQTGNGIIERETWHFQVDNLKALVGAVSAGKIPLNAILANTVFLGQQARSLKGSMDYPGVKVWATKNIAAGRR
jgi:hypothetical protein